MNTQKSLIGRILASAGFAFGQPWLAAMKTREEAQAIAEGRRTDWTPHEAQRFRRERRTLNRLIGKRQARRLRCQGYGETAYGRALAVKQAAQLAG